MSKREPYKTHARRDGDTTRCNLAINTGRGVLPLALWPSGITCKNCLDQWYPIGRRDRWKGGRDAPLVRRL